MVQVLKLQICRFEDQRLQLKLLEYCIFEEEVKIPVYKNAEGFVLKVNLEDDEKSM